MFLLKATNLPLKNLRDFFLFLITRKYNNFLLKIIEKIKFIPSIFQALFYFKSSFPLHFFTEYHYFESKLKRYILN